jgi:hypothetical protein
LVVFCSAIGWLLFLFVLGVAVAAPVALSVPQVLRRVLAAVAVAALGWATGRGDALTVPRRASDGRPRLGAVAAVIVVGVALQWLLKGSRALPWAAALGCIALVAFAIGTRSQRGPAAAGGD